MSQPPRRSPWWVPALFVILAAASFLCWWVLYRLGDVRRHLAAFYLAFSLAFLCYLAALWLVHRDEHGAGPASRGRTWGLTVGVLLTGLAFRALFWATPPFLSDDIYRYLWDGRVQLAGMDPYAYPPNDPALRILRDARYRHINFPHLRTIYPPLAELAFRAGARINLSLVGQKLVFALAELVTCACLLFVLIRRSLSPLWVVAYAWHPLTVLEIAGSGHNDPVGIAMLWLGIAAWHSRAFAGCALAWAAAFLSKFSSLIMAPWWWCRGIGRRWLAAAMLLAVLPLVVHRNAVNALIESLSAMTVRFESNSSAYLLLAGLLHQPGAARMLVVALWGGFVLWWARRKADPIRYLLGAFGAAALLSPVLHPWYLLWLVPCFCFWRQPAFLTLTGTVVLSYTVWPLFLVGGPWVVPVWARLIEYTPVVVLGLWGLRRCVWGSSFLPATKPSLSVRS